MSGTDPYLQSACKEAPDLSTMEAPQKCCVWPATGPLFLAGCAVVVTGGILWLLPKGARSAGRAKGICSQRVRRHRLCI